MSSKESMLRRRVANALEEYIYSHNPGEKLPSEPVLAKQLGVSRTTLRAVLEKLAASGVVQKRHGSGTYISPKPCLVQETLLHYIRYPVLIQKKGYTATERDRKVFVCGASPQICQNLNLAEGEKCVVVQQVYCADGHMAVFCRDTLPASIFPPDRLNSVLTALHYRDLRDVIFEETGRQVGQNVVGLHAVFNTESAEMKPYIAEGDVRPMLLMRGCCFDHNQQALFFNEAYLDTRYLDLHLNR